jgi:cyclophilin family peptidyl-prolyl cis-trans isomerase
MKNFKIIFTALLALVFFLAGCQSSVPGGGQVSAEPTTVQTLKASADSPGFVIKTSKGVLKGELYTDVAPNTVLNFVTLAKKGFYNGLTFHRVVPGFVIQGGCPKGDGTGGPGYSIPAEFNTRPHGMGVLAMARSQDPDSAGSQFYICITSEKGNIGHLDRNYTVFGKVTDGMASALSISQGDKIESIEITGKLPASLEGKEIKKSGIK